jgi:predicted solute-binding protein
MIDEAKCREACNVCSDGINEWACAKKAGEKYRSRVISAATYRAMAEEYQELMTHMAAGGDYMEFMAKRQHKDTK